MVQALFHAIESKQIDVVRLLLDAGVETNGTNEQGNTARYLAFCSEMEEMIELFPAEQKYDVPTEYYLNNHYTDMVPTIFDKNK